jgi:hypothetical protein
MVIELVCRSGIGFGIGYGLDACSAHAAMADGAVHDSRLRAGVKTMIRSAEVQRKTEAAAGRGE